MRLANEPPLIAKMLLTVKLARVQMIHYDNASMGAINNFQLNSTRN